MKLANSILSFLFTFLSCALLSHVGDAFAVKQEVTEVHYAGRTVLVQVPSHLPAPGTRALVTVLHGGLGNAQRIESGQSEHGLNMDAVAEKGGFIVAYLNGTPVTRFFGSDKLGWNAGGGCCGQPAEKNVDDVAYVKGAIEQLVRQYGIDPNRIFGVGHSNGAMMIQRLMCETGIYAAIVPISGPLNLESGDCAAARGKRVLAIHGAVDENVPVVGGRGTKGISRVVFNSQEHSQQSFTSIGAAYDLQVVKGADHNLDHIGAEIRQAESQTIAEKSARFFGLLN